MLAVQCVLHQESHFPFALVVWEKSNPHNQFFYLPATPILKAWSLFIPPPSSIVMGTLI